MKILIYQHLSAPCADGLSFCLLETRRAQPRGLTHCSAALAKREAEADGTLAEGKHLATGAWSQHQQFISRSQVAITLGSTVCAYQPGPCLHYRAKAKNFITHSQALAQKDPKHEAENIFCHCNSFNTTEGKRNVLLSHPSAKWFERNSEGRAEIPAQTWRNISKEKAARRKNSLLSL